MYVLSDVKTGETIVLKFRNQYYIGMFEKLISNHYTIPNYLMSSVVYDNYDDLIEYVTKFKIKYKYISDIHDADIYKDFLSCPVILNLFSKRNHINAKELADDIQYYKIKCEELKKYKQTYRISSIDERLMIYKVFVTSGIEGVSKLTKGYVNNIKQLMIEFEFNYIFISMGLSPSSYKDKTQYELGNIKLSLLDKYLVNIKRLTVIHYLILPYLIERMEILNIKKNN